MKRIFATIAFSAALVAAASCEKFFTKEPTDKFSSETFFTSQNDLKLYTNGLISTAMPSAASTALGDDTWTDFCGTKASTGFFYPGGYYTAGKASGWSAGNWGFLRQVAYMLDNMESARPAVSEQIYNHYEGVARFFRAYATFNKVKMFGDCYFIDHVIKSDDELLYAPRQDREYVIHKVIEDLQFASGNCLTEGAGINTAGRVYVNKYVALALASRICLYEGTYRKYHETNPSTNKPWNNEYETSEELLQMAMDFSKELIETNQFKLHGNFRELFTSEVLPSDEVIWGRSYSEELSVRHNVTYSYCSTTSSQCYSPTKDFVMMFLKSDGKPMASGEISVTQELNNRDKRLAATIVCPGQKKQDQSGSNVNFSPDFTWTETGYIWLKWILTDHLSMNDSKGVCNNSVPLFRYAEVLLNYAEAAAELGKMSRDIWNATIGELRKTHGGISTIYYPVDGTYVEDEFLKGYYSNVNLNHPVNLSNTLLEIRRERAVELTMEGDSRYCDLMRWNCGDLAVIRYNGRAWRGIWITESEAKNGFDFNGKHYTVSKTKNTNETNYKITSSSDDKNFNLSNGTYGYLLYNYELEWDDKMYLHPIPTTASNVNPDLYQNDGWQWM